MVSSLTAMVYQARVQGDSRNVNSFAKDDGRSQQRVCHGSADCRPGGVCTSLAPTDFGNLTGLEYADACTKAWS